MNDTTETSEARRRLKRISELRAIFGTIVGAAAGLAILSLVRLLSGVEEAFPSIIVSLLVLVGVVGNAMTRSRYVSAIADVELAARNVGRAEARAEAADEVARSARSQ